MAPVFLTVDEVADILKVSAESVRQLAEREVRPLKSVAYGKSYKRFRKEAVIEWIEKEEKACR